MRDMGPTLSELDKYKHLSYGLWRILVYIDITSVNCKDDNEYRRKVEELQKLRYMLCDSHTIDRLYEQYYLKPEDAETREMINSIINGQQSKPKGGGVVMNFGEALELLKQGNKMRRSGWNGKGLYVQYCKGKDHEHAIIEPFFVINNKLNSFNTWVPSVSDCLAEDWEVAAES